MGFQLAHFPHRHLVGGAAHDPERVQVIQLHQLDDRTGIEIVAHDHGDLVAEQRVDGGLAAAQHRMIYRIVVDQGRQVNQLHHRGEPHVAGSDVIRGAGRQQHQGGAEHLAPHAQQVVVDFGDDGEVGGDDPAKLGQHPVELPANRTLDRRQADGGQLPHRYLPTLARDLTRSFTS